MKTLLRLMNRKEMIRGCGKPGTIMNVAVSKAIYEYAAKLPLREKDIQARRRIARMA